MDYAEMVSQIMAAEQGAKVLAEESRARRQQLQAGLELLPPGTGLLRQHLGALFGGHDLADHLGVVHRNTSVVV